MASKADPRLARHRYSVPNAPDTRTLRTSETLLRAAALAQAKLAEEAAEASEPQIFAALQARYG